MKKTTLLTLLVMMLSLSNFSNAAIVYNDIADETLASMGTLEINFDGAGAAEFTFADNAFGGPVEPGIFFSLNNGFVMVSPGEWDVITGLAVGTPINGTSSFLNNSGDGYIDPFWGTTLFPTTDTYIGAQFELGGNTHFGWILVNWNAAGTFIVKSFAYENTPDAPINAGDVGGGGIILVASISVDGTGGASVITTGGGTLQMTASVLPANADDATYTWSVQNGTGSASISAGGLLTALSDGTVTVVATANDGSGIIGEKVITISNQTAGITSAQLNYNPIYPNPASDVITVNRNGSEAGELRIVSITGQEVMHLNLFTEETTVDVSTFASGVYVVCISNEEGMIQERLVIK